jgi:pyruvate dehydrogenase E1 component
VFGDGEMDEPESIASLTLAAREQLDNLTFIINCNLQRLDGPVRGNGQIVQELESLFTGAGWNVIKVLWGSDWDALFARDRNHVLLQRLASTVDGQYQNLGAKDGAYNIEHFFRQDPEVQKLVAHMSEGEIDALKRGGHDFRKLHAAFSAARAHQGRPTVILAKTKKGYGMGGAGESRMTSHQAKKLDLDAVKAFRDRFALPLSDDDVAQLRFYKPDADSLEMRYLQERRTALGGALPARKGDAPKLAVPPLANWGSFALQAEGKECPPPWPRCACSAACSRMSSSARVSCPSWPTRRAPSAWPACSVRSASTRRMASCTSRKTPAHAVVPRSTRRPVA